jgi:uncharacterized protein
VIPIRDHPDGATFAVRVQPRARKTAITGVFGSGDAAVLKVALAAPPVEGRANEVLIDYFADMFEVPRSAVYLVAGASGRCKIIRIAGRSAAELTSVFEKIWSA